MNFISLGFWPHTEAKGWSPVPLISHTNPEHAPFCVGMLSHQTFPYTAATSFVKEAQNMSSKGQDYIQVSQYSVIMVTKTEVGNQGEVGPYTKI